MFCRQVLVFDPKWWGAFASWYHAPKDKCANVGGTFSAVCPSVTLHRLISFIQFGKKMAVLLRSLLCLQTVLCISLVLSLSLNLSLYLSSSSLLVFIFYILMIRFNLNPNYFLFRMLNRTWTNFKNIWRYHFSWGCYSTKENKGKC